MTRKNFVLLFLAFGYTLHFVTKFLLNQSAQGLGPTPEQQAWQQYASTILWPIQIALIGPIDWLQQDPDPPPPFRIVLFAAYWSVLALGLHYLWSKRKLSAAARRSNDGSQRRLP